MLFDEIKSKKFNKHSLIKLIPWIAWSILILIKLASGSADPDSPPPPPLG